MCSHCRVASRLQNCVNGLRWKVRQRVALARNGSRKKEKYMNRLKEGKVVCCVWERRLKPFEVKMVKIAGVKPSGPNGGLAEVTLENGIRFRGSSAKSVHLFQDKARLRGALEAPTRANVLIFTHGEDAKRHLRDKGCLESVGAEVDFGATERGAGE